MQRSFNAMTRKAVRAGAKAIVQALRAPPPAPKVAAKQPRPKSAPVTDYRARGRLVVTLCEVMGLGHTWSGGVAGRTYSDPKGPDASRMIWAFMARQFAKTRVGDERPPLPG